jgi:hypothetical protein
MFNDKYFCRNCQGLRNYQVLHEVKKTGSDEDNYFQWVENYCIIECLGCNTISFLKIYGDTEMVAQNEQGEYDYFYNNNIYPYYLEIGNELNHSHYIPISIRAIYEETISAFKAGSFILTAGGLRAIIEAICNHLNIKQENLADRIDLLHKQGYLTLSESKRLHSIRFLGNDALHEIEKPPKESLYILLEIVNHLLSNLFINDEKLKGKMDIIIDKYDEYLKLIQNNINKDMIDKELTINQILGKSKRLIPNRFINEFEDKFKKAVKLGNHDFIYIVDEKSESIYKIVKEPEITLPW